MQKNQVFNFPSKLNVYLISKFLNFLSVIQNEIDQQTETDKKLTETIEEQNYEEVTEFITENFKNHQPDNVIFIEELLRKEDCKNVFIKIANIVNMKQYFENICTAFLLSSVIEMSDGKIFCSYFLLPALKITEYSRGIENSLIKCIDTFPQTVIKYTLVPLLNSGKNCPFVNVSKLKPEHKKELLIAYFKDAEYPTPEWTLQILFNLFKSSNSKDLLSEMINCLINSFREYPQNVQFGKLVHLVSQKFVQFTNVLENSDELKKRLNIVIEYNESSFKNVCIGLLEK